MQVIVDGLLTTYERSGTGKTVVLLHGWGDRALGLRILSDGLAPDYDVIAPDLPGFGGTQAPAVAWGLDEYVKFVALFLRKIGVDDVYAFLGHSNGGGILIRGISGGILQAERLILLSSAGIRGEYKGRTRLLRYGVKAGKLLAAPLPDRMRRGLRKKVYATVGSDMLVAEHLQETFKRVVGEDVRADAPRVDIPTLLIYGEKDTATPVRYGEWFRELMPDATLQVLPGAGHFVYIDRPLDTMRAVQEFLR